jgi:glutamyl-tRNA synthetase
MDVRVRFAPSPTGFQHIGSARTALFNYLFARASGGRFVLRIEDTDRERFQEQALQDIYNTYAWLGFHWDEGPDVGGPHAPYLQSERTQAYRRHAAQLLASGAAYRCFCSPERLQRLKEQKQRRHEPSGYDRRCRELSPEERTGLEAEGRSAVVRLKVPLSGSTSFQDLLLGSIETANPDINPDPVLLKSDGYPTYHLANVVDDHLMGITHVLRAQEWLPSTPLHVLLYQAFGWQVPSFCHLPMVLGQDGHKLSKRHGATRVIEFRERGYLPEAILNYLALLGWSYDDSRELFSLGELERLFSVEKLNKAPAVFDYRKLEWFNGLYIRRLPAERLAELLLPFLQREGLVGQPAAAEQHGTVLALVPLVQERLTVLADVSAMVRFLFQELPAVPAAELIPKRLDRDSTAAVLRELSQVCEGFDSRSDGENEERFRELAERLGLKLGDLLMPLRVAITGSRVSPPLVPSIRLLGRERTLARIREAIAVLGAQ